MALRHTTLHYQGSISLYIKLPWIYLILLDSAYFYHGTTSL